MYNLRQYVRLIVLAGALLCALALPNAVRAEPIMLTPTVTNQGNGLFSYQYTVVNTSSFDFSAVSIMNLPRIANAVQNIITPAGFNAFFDPGLGQLDFVIGSLDPAFPGFAAGSTISGFSFLSPFGPGLTDFTATRLDENFAPVEVSGTLLAPQQNQGAPVPEPTTMILLATGLAGLATKAYRGKAKKT